MFSKSCEYALRAAIFIAKQNILGNKIGSQTISEAINSPEAFTGKILQRLVKKGIVTSIKGPYGGFILKEEKAKKTKMIEIVKAIDGDTIYEGCGLGLSACNSKKPCPLHDKFAGIRSDLKNMLETNTIYDLIQIEPGETLQLKR